MTMSHWRNGPVRECRTVLVVVPFVAAGARLFDALPLVEADHRILTVFTVPPTAAPGVAEFLRARECLVLPWQEAVRHEFDLVLAASRAGLAELTGKALLLPAGELATGDLLYDRLLASIPFRAHYRQALGLGRGDKLVVVASATVELLTRMLAELPARRYRVAAVVDPDVWSACGGWQVRAWFADCLAAGLLLLPPAEGWQAALVAANLVVGAHGPVPHYGAAIGLPVMTAPPRLDQPLLDQLSAAMTSEPGRRHEPAVRTISSVGFAGDVLRKQMYRLLDLPEPARAVPCSPVPLPRPICADPAWWLDDRPA